MNALPLDHLVINTRFETDAAQVLFTQLGFQLTDRGRHSMGSINHLIVFDANYLELIGLPTDGGPLRQEILDQCIGIDGLVYRPESAAAVHAALTERGLPLLPVHSFTRGVVVAGQSRQASFHTVRFKPGTFNGGRVYYCEHETPELVWQPDRAAHPNTARNLDALVIVSPDPKADAQRHAVVAFGEAEPHEGGWRVSGAGFSTCFIDAGAARQRFAAAAVQPLGRSRYYAAIEVRVGDLPVAERIVRALGTRVVTQPVAGGLAVLLPDFNTTLVLQG